MLFFWLQLVAPPSFAQFSNTAEPFLYDTSAGKDYWKAGGKISVGSPIWFYDESFSTIFVSSLVSYSLNFPHF